ncbi:hypothetical protein M408DRAFT_332407 [Serendipita vermifera MAFF 305830]|uniref:Ketoreductase (KR) domain-containing protein n=1 Tax=Serendipita vermifera MAFF 305830 TaxID=933852 RepID=A0A0C2WA49_SERVB|nr:hypothetical protein M408DRAFT_332407 [Serendipita vermifera MAFF 305830]
MATPSALVALFFDSLITKWKTLPETVVDLTGRTVIVTGANVGLGLGAAKRFYAMNPARLIIAVRTLSKGEKAKRDILESGKKEGPPGSVREETQVDVWSLDLCDFESVRAFAAKCEKELSRIDILLENAAIMNSGWTVTRNGWESDLQTNVLSTFLLASLLAPIVAKTSKLPVPVPGSTLKPHIVIVASDAHYISPFRVRNEPNILAALNDRTHYFKDDRYSDTKAIDILITQQLAKSPALKDVVVCSVNPGFCRSDLMRTWPTIIREIMYAILARTAEEGSKTYTWASLTNDIPPGSYTSSCVVTRAGGIVAGDTGERIRAQLWDEIIAVLIEEAPEIEGVLRF